LGWKWEDLCVLCLFTAASVFVTATGRPSLYSFMYDIAELLVTCFIKAYFMLVHVN